MMDKVHTIILYIRISMEDVDVGISGKEESNSITNQRNLLRSFVLDKPEFQDSQIIELIDDGYTGTHFERPAMQKLLNQAKEKTAECIIVKDFSRFGRDYLTVSDYVDQIFPVLGIRFISVNDGYDSAAMNGTASGLDMAFRNIVYAYYSREISEKVKSGKRAKAQRGAYLSSFAPMGYRKDEKNKNRLVVDKQSAEIVRRIFQLSGAGLSVVEVARILNLEQVPTPSQLKKQQGCHHKWWDRLQEDNLWDISTITRILRDERYTGAVIYGRKSRKEFGNYKVKNTEKSNWIVVPGCHEPIVTAEEFQAAQNTLRVFTEAKGRKKQQHLFGGKIRCGVCGYALKCEGKTRPQYHCLTAKRTLDCACDEHGIYESDLAETVWQALQLYCQALLERKEYEKKGPTAERTKEIRKQLAVYQTSVKNMDEQKAILYEKMLDGNLSREQFAAKRDVLIKQQRGMQENIRRFEAELQSLLREVKSEVPSIKILKDCLQEDRLTREMVEVFVACIYVYDDRRVRIDWKFDLLDK